MNDRYWRSRAVSGVARRADSSWERCASWSGAKPLIGCCALSAVVTRMLNGLRKQGLLEEQPAPHDAIAWREGEDGGRMMLVITAAGLKALDGEAPERSERAKSRAKKARAEPKAANAQALLQKIRRAPESASSPLSWS